MKNEQEKILTELKHFLKEDLSLNTSLNQESLIVGSDVVALFEFIDKKYPILWGDFDIWKYFDEDPDIFSLIAFFKVFIFRKAQVVHTKPNFKVQHLVEVIKKGSWFEPKI